MKNCLDEGTLQAYLDGELSPATMKDASAHVAACSACASAVREAEAELDMFAIAFADDASLVVPTARLRERLDTAIAELSPALPPRAASVETKPRLARLFAALAATLVPTPARATAFASLVALVVVGIVVAPVIRERRTNNSSSELAAKRDLPAPAASIATTQPNTTTGEAATSSATNENAPVAPDSSIAATANKNANDATASRNSGDARVLDAGFKPSRDARTIATRRAKTPAATGAEGERKADEKDLALPGEENYLIAIASLNRVIDAGGAAAMPPALRADLERNVADLDMAISASRRRAQRNPQDKDAADFLFAAYQSKVELLRTVADQSQMAMLGR